MDSQSTDFQEHSVTLPRLKLHIVQQGAGDIVLLLHGFPEFWYSWRHQLEAIAGAGFCAVAPDLPGYNESDAPTGIAAYRTHALVGDIADLIKSYKCGPVHVVGHDWGGLIAWRLASLHPHLVRRLAVLNAPHPAAYQVEIQRNPRQWLKSLYTLFFQAPVLPELLLKAGDFSVLEKTWKRQPVTSEAFSDDDIRLYKQALHKKGLRPPLNYYRAVPRYAADMFGQPQEVTAPTLVIFGEQDQYICKSVLTKFAPWVPNLKLHTIPMASHWVQNDAPQQVNEALIRFLRFE